MEDDKMAKDVKDPVEGKNVTVWFPDSAVADKAAALAEELKTSMSALVVEVVAKALPAIEKHKKMRDIPLDGVRVNV
jgi:hypothetical protein